MPFSINGTFTIINTFVPDTPILSADTNENNEDVADGLTTLWARTVAYEMNLRIFTANDTYVPTDGLLAAKIECVGGGGGGGGTAVAPSGFLSVGNGGGGGEYAMLMASPGAIGASKIVTIGAAGAGGAAGSTLGANGGQTSVGAICIANGGHGDRNGGDGGTGDLTLDGGNGASPGLLEANTSTLGWGAGGIAGGGFGTGCAGHNVIVSTTGNTGANYGSGGGGGAAFNGSAAAAGGPGAPGIVVITEFIGPT